MPCAPALADGPSGVSRRGVVLTPYFLQLGARRRGSSVSDGLRRRLWRRVVVSSSGTSAVAFGVATGQSLCSTFWGRDDALVAFSLLCRLAAVCRVQVRRRPPGRRDLVATGWLSPSCSEGDTPVVTIRLFWLLFYLV
ncbi:hypothetical protein Taro_009824, partial [Colocasia esculenta]|nr:hypothetical protein [Colocasia esculenta]